MKFRHKCDFREKYFVHVEGVKTILKVGDVEHILSNTLEITEDTVFVQIDGGLAVF